MITTQPPSHLLKMLSRRRFVVGGTIAGTTTALALSVSSNILPSQAETGDLAILNAAIDLENQGIWAYGVAGGKLSQTPVGKTVLALGLRNQADHQKHRDALIGLVKKLGGTPAPAQDSYDLSSYIQAGEGNLSSDVNIAKLALALEVDAALAYIAAFGQLKDPALLAAAGTIAPVEASHATAIRAAFIALGTKIEYIPAAFVTPETRSAWILKV
jgi:Ferritin-like domain